MKTVLFDLDGVLADFTLGHRQLANSEFGVPIFDTITRPHSSWDDPDLNKEQNNRLWELIKDSKTSFWLSLKPLIDSETFERINRLQEKFFVYFVTTRVGETCKLQSALWLELHGVELPSVIVTTHKGSIAEALDAHFAIDDKPDNVLDLAGHVEAYVIDRAWNQKMGGRYALDGPNRVKSVNEFIDKLN